MVEGRWGELEDEVKPKTSLRPAIKIQEQVMLRFIRNPEKVSRADAPLPPPPYSHHIYSYVKCMQWKEETQECCPTWLVINCHTLEREEFRGKELRKSPGRD